MGTNAGIARKYWKGLDELQQTPEFVEKTKTEFPQEPSIDKFLAAAEADPSSTNRRDFLKFLGFSVAAASVAACESPVVKALPYVVKPEEVTPGVANWYASTYYDGAHYASILVKSREGRPIHIKGNKDWGITKGAINPQIAASVLSLYSSDRLQHPYIKGEAASWQEVDSAIGKALRQLDGKPIVLLSGTEISPAAQAAIAHFKATYSGAHSSETTVPASRQEGEQELPASVEAPAAKVVHIQYDAISYNGIREANSASFGKRIIPDYDFSKAKVIVSVACDFLNSWVLPTQFVGQYLSHRNPDGEWMSKHYQFESNLSQTGSNADVRALVKPSQQGVALAYLYGAITGKGSLGVDTSALRKETRIQLDAAAADLKAAKGASLVVAGSNRSSIQTLVNAINDALGNYAATINLNNPIALHQSEDRKVEQLMQDMSAGKIGAVIMWDTNPVYSLADGEAFKAALENVPVTVSMAPYADETASCCTYLCPQSHALETWSDYAPKAYHRALAQPTIRPLYETRPVGESFLIWSGRAAHVGKSSRVYYDHIKSLWKEYAEQHQTGYADSTAYWNAMVHQSCAGDAPPAPSPLPFKGDVAAAARAIAAISAGAFEVALYQKAAIGNGSQAANPWLQEMPDTITKVTWDNYATMAYEDIKKLGCEEGLGQETPSTVVEVTIEGTAMRLPAYPQAGQMPGTIGIAVGYGRGQNGEKIGKAAYHQTGHYGESTTDPIGRNAFVFVSKDGDFDRYDAAVSKTTETYQLACTQTHSTVMARNSIVKETTLDSYRSQSKGAYNHQHTLHSGWDHEEKPIGAYDLWSEHPVEHVGHRWGMTIDLNSCIGCGSCLIACQSENNVPVVGKDEVRRGREMHWLRIDRYYASDVEPTVGTRDPESFEEEGYEGLMQPSENPKVVHMPMMCQHCNHAPCETVCPVAATTHSNEGLNQMTYNRCIGTRYCGNNCPYKVRRFNWFNYPSYRKFTEVNPAQDDLGRMVLNPDVVVRTRGVMEKCSFCVQKIQAGKLVAKKENRMVRDGDITTACADVCPTDAIIVGDWNDKESAVRKSSEEDRAYQALEEVGVKPNVWYKVKVRNEANESLAQLQHEHGYGEHESHGQSEHEKGKHDHSDSGREHH